MLRQSKFTYFLIIALSVLLWSCKVTKNVPEGKLLLTENQVSIDGDKTAQYNVNPYIVQRPNLKFVFVPLKLSIYNLANKNYEQKWDDKIIKYKDSSHFFTDIFSLKQMVGYANFNKNFNKWLLKNGELPTIIDELKIKRTLKSLNQFYIDQGYFKVQSTYDVDTLSTDKGKVIYKIKPGNPFYLDSISEKITSPVIDSLYRQYQNATFIKSGEVFKRENFEKEAERLTSIFRNAGVYHFSKYSINFRNIDSTRNDYKTNVLVDISNRIIEGKNGIEESDYKINYIDKVNIYTDYSYRNNNNINDSLQYNGFDIYAYDKIRYKPKHLTQSIFLKPGETYSDNNLDLTRKHLKNLNTFKSIRISFEEKSDSLLIANILLTPTKQYAFKAETEATHSNIKPFGVSGKLSFRNNNTFRGNEILQLSIQGSFLNTNSIFTNNFFNFNAWEVGADLSYKAPRIIFPIPISKKIDTKMSPKTIITFGTSLQRNIGLDKQRITGIIEYNWQASTKINHSFELFNTQFIKNLNTDSFFDVYSSEYTKLQRIQTTYFPNYLMNNPLEFMSYALSDTEFINQNYDAYKEIINILYRYGIITEDILVNSVSYGFLYSDQTNFKDLDYKFLRVRLSSAGLLSNLIAQKNGEGNNQILGTNVAQYLKLDFEFKKYWDVNLGNILVFRTNLGVALPYGNSDAMPFSRSYFAGGTNDIRAWKIYDLGPGSERSGLEFNVGNLKFLTSFEHRFNIINSLKGALFVDAGNIWEMSSSNYVSYESKFKGLKSLKEIAIGNGFGLRYDFSFLVFRADLAFKMYKPYETIDKQWFDNYNFKNAQLNIGINYPF